MQVQPDSKVLVAIDSQPGGAKQIPGLIGVDADFNWDSLIEINKADQIFVINSDGAIENNLRLWAIRNRQQDNLVLSFACSLLQPAYPHNKIQVFLVNESASAPGRSIDKSTAVNWDSPPPPPVQVLLYFYNTFAGLTPAQALKHWDGAHTGPDSARHGLVHLLKAAEDQRIPVLLADLATPQNLSALDYMGLTASIRNLEDQGLAIIPDVSTISLSSNPTIHLPTWVYQVNSEYNRNVRMRFNLGESEIWTAQEWPGSLNFPNGYQFIFPQTISSQLAAKICNWGSIKVFCSITNKPKTELPPDLDSQGLTTDVKRLLLSQAGKGDQQFIILGGDFGESAWGNVDEPQLAFSYVKNHPWIRFLGLYDLQTMPASFDDTIRLPNVPQQAIPITFENGLTSQELVGKIIDETLASKTNPLSDAEWQMFFQMLDSPDPKRHLLTTYSMREVGYLFAAARWAESPREITNCDEDIDWDGIGDCILASQNIFLAFQNKGGSLVVGFIKEKDGYHQFAAPSYQVANGLSDAFRWTPEQGVYGDPDALGASIVEPSFKNIQFQNNSKPGQISFANPDGRIRKDYILKPNGVSINYILQTPQIVQIQLTIDPWLRFSPGWSNQFYSQGLSNQLFIRQNSIAIQLSSNLELQSNIFSTSRQYMTNPEDPNFDYGLGHYQLFPYSLVTVNGHGEFWIDITVDGN